MSGDILTKNRGSDVDLEIQFLDENDSPIDYTGYSVIAFEIHPSFVGNTTVSFLDEATGKVSVRIEWADYSSGINLPFRVQLSLGNQQDSSPEFFIRFE